MRKAAGVIMMGFGVFTIVGGLILIIPRVSGGLETVWVRLAFAILLVVAGIGILRRKAYWWALLAAIGMVLVGMSNAISAFQDPGFLRLDTATRLLLAAGSWAFWGVPGLLSVIFLVKRKDEFGVSPEA